jgi:arylsulfatase A-like enzyme
MKIRLVLIPCLLVLACAPATEPPPTPLALSLIGEMSDAEVRNPIEVADVEPITWTFGGDSAPGRHVGFTAGWRDTAVVDGVWRGVTASPKPVLELVADEALGGGDEIWGVEVRMRASAGDELRLTVLGEDGPPAAAFAAPQGPAAVYATSLVPGEMTTYRLERVRQFGMGPRVRKDARRIVLLPSDEPGAEVEIESVRLVLRGEHLATLETGPGWHGLSEIWMEALASRPGEELVFTVDLPERPYLDLSVGTVARKPVEMEVEVAAEGIDPVVRRRVVSRPEVWQPFPVDLAALAGRRATVTLRSRSALADAVSLWGAPTVRSRGAGPAAVGADAPQGVILFLSDTLRRDHLSLYGYQRETAPFLTGLAKEGVVFDDAVVQGTWTKVSVPSILTSLYPRTHGLVDFPDRLPAAVTTLAEVFRAAGYATMQTSSVPFSGQLTNLHQGVEEMHESASLGEDPAEGSRSKTARPLMDRLLPWITAKKDVPFFALLHTMDAHHPFPPRRPYDTEWGADGALDLHGEEEAKLAPLIDNPLLKNFTVPERRHLEAAGLDPDAFVRREVDWLDGSILAQDSELERLIAHLDSLGLRDKVLLVFLADHGTELLDHDSHWHGTTVYSELTDVPLVMWGPGFLPQGVRVEQPVEMIDLFPTLVELAGLEVPEAAQGRSLVPLLDAHRDGGEGRAPTGWRAQPRFAERENQVADFEPFYSRRSSAVFDGRWKLVRNESPPPGVAELQLFDRVADRRETTDLAEEHPEVVADLIRKLDRWGAWAEGQKVKAEDTREMSPEELERLRSLGYI